MKAVSTILPPGSRAIRIFGAGSDYGDPYEYLLVMEPTEDAETCILSGLKSDGKFGAHHAVAIGEELLRLGYKKVIWVRMLGDEANRRERRVVVNLGARQ